MVRHSSPLFPLSIVVALGLLVAACAPAAAPTPTPVPKPAAPAVPPTPAPTVVPAAPTTAPAKPGPAGTPPAATAAPPAPAATVAAKPAALEKVSMRWDWIAYGYHAVYVVARDKGFYAAEGLDVELAEGRGSATTVQVVGSGANTFGLADGGAMALAVARDAPIKMVAGLLQKSPNAFISLEETGIKKIQDLKGKTVAGTAGTNTVAVLPAVFAKNGMSTDDVKLVTVEPAALSTSVLQKRTDAVVTFFFTDGARMEETGAKLSYLLFSDLGVNLMSHGLFTTNDMIKNKPDLVRRFVKASLRGYEYSRQNPSEAIDLLAKGFQVANKQTWQKMLQTSFTLAHTKRTDGQPIGWMAKEDWEETQDLLAKYVQLPKTQPVEAYYTNEFLPK